MYAEISPETAGRYSLSRFTDEYGKAQETATVTKVTTGDVSASDADGREVAAMPVSFDTNAFGQVSGELQLPLDGDRVAWSPNLVFPGLGEGDRLIRRTRLPERAPILARDGTPLAEGPVDRSLLAARHGGGRRGLLPSPEQNTEQVQHGFPPDTPTGTSGLELAFNDRLAGQPGGQLVAAPPPGRGRGQAHGHRHQQAGRRHAGAYHDRSEAPAGRDRRARRPVRRRRRARRD